MSVNEPMIFLADAPEFTFPVGEFIALEVAKGEGIGTLHDAYPEKVPNPIIVRRWAKNIIGFRLLMEEAEAMRAERMADETVTISDDPEILAADKAQRVKSRQWLAGKLSDRYGSGGEKAGDTNFNFGVIVSDEQLMAIAAQGLPSPAVLEGESERVLPGKERDLSVCGESEVLETPLVEATVLSVAVPGSGQDMGGNGESVASEPAGSEPDPYDF